MSDAQAAETTQTTSTTTAAAGGDAAAQQHSADAAGDNASAGEKRKASGDAGEVDEKGGKKAKTSAAAAAGYMSNISALVDKEHRHKSLNEIVDLPVDTLDGVGEKQKEMWAAFKVHTIRDLAKWKFFLAARAITTLADHEKTGKAAKGEHARHEASKVNINGIVDKAFEQKSFTDISKAPPSALSGLAQWADDVLKPGKIKTIKQLAQYKPCLVAEALVEAAQYETADMASR